MIEALICILIGVIIGARFAGAINPVIDSAWGWAKAKIAG